MIEITKENFQQEVMQSEQLCVVDFWASWCAPCKMIGQELQQVQERLPQVKFCKINVDEQMDLAVAHGVQSIPMLLIVKDGKILKELIGYRPADTLALEIGAFL